MTDESVDVLCDWCGAAFSYVPSSRGGVAPRYCRRSHRQRAYEARKAATAEAPETSSRARAADLLGILPTIEQHVLTLSQARGETRPSIDGVRAAVEIESILERHTLFVVIEAEREGTPFTEIADALNMTELDAKAWITTTLDALEEAELQPLSSQ